MRRALPLLLALASLLAGCDLEPDGAALATLTPTATNTVAGNAGATPTPAGEALRILEPGELERLLLGGERPFSTLPAAYRVDITGIERTSVLAPGMERAVVFTLAGPDFANSVTFYLHGDAPAARQSYSDVTALRKLRADSVQGMGFPAKTVSFGAPDRQTGTTAIYLLAGQVLIEATSTLAVDSPSGQFAHAYELAVAARDLLLSVAR